MSGNEVVRRRSADRRSRPRTPSRSPRPAESHSAGTFVSHITCSVPESRSSRDRSWRGSSSSAGAARDSPVDDGGRSAGRSTCLLVGVPDGQHAQPADRVRAGARARPDRWGNAGRPVEQHDDAVRLRPARAAVRGKRRRTPGIDRANRRLSVRVRPSARNQRASGSANQAWCAARWRASTSRPKSEVGSRHTEWA